jgi:diguanylate cyclase (GGDEF)-like protein
MRAGELEAETLREVDRLAKVSQWQLDLESGQFRCLASLFDVHGLQPPEDSNRQSFTLPLDDWLALLPEGDSRHVRQFVDSVRTTGEASEFQYQVKSGRGTRHLSIVAEISERRDGKAIQLIGYTQDVTALRRAQERDRQARRELEYHRSILKRITNEEPLRETLASLCRHLERQLDGAHCGVMIHDRGAGRLRLGAAPTVSARLAGLMNNVSVAESLGASGQAVKRGEIVIIDDLRTASELPGLTELAVETQTAGTWALPLKRHCGEAIGVIGIYRSTPHRPTRAEIQLVSRIANLATLAIERSAPDDALLTTANTDPLTGLLNRARFMELADQQLKQESGGWAVVYLDIESFKPLLEHIGNVAGDSILVEIVARLRAALGDCLLARFGHDDVFVALLPASSPQAAQKQGDLVSGIFREGIKLSGREFFLVPLVGVAVSHHDADVYQLVSDAVHAMHAAQRDGLRRARVYDTRMHDELMRRVNQEGEVRAAVDRGELLLYYQPLLDLRLREWVGVEALVRWRHPTRGLVDPGDFIPLAEEGGLIGTLGERVLEMALEQARQWRQRMPWMRISVNVSAVQLEDAAFADQVLAQIERAGVPANALALEVTESALMREFQLSHGTLSRLRAEGVRSEIDDFGTGYSSLARLGDLPVASLKIDRSFVAALAQAPMSAAVVRAITDVGLAHGLTVVAEGIEDLDTMTKVESIGCRVGQGFFIGRPGPADQIEALMLGPVPELLRRPEDEPDVAASVSRELATPSAGAERPVRV